MQHEAGLTDDEVLEHLRVVLLAANETTVNLIADTLKMVLTDQRFRTHLSGGHMTLADALDQVLWDAAPMSLVAGRWATGDTELGGQQIKAGDMLLLGLAVNAPTLPSAPTWPRPSTGTAPTWPSAPVRTSAPARTSAGPSPRRGSTSCSPACRTSASRSRRRS